MAYFFLGALAIVLFVLLLQNLENAETNLLVKTIKWTLVGVMGLAAIYMTLMGRLLHVAALGVLLFLVLKRDIQRLFKNKTPLLPLEGPLSKKEAAALLQVDINASSKEVQEAYSQVQTKDSTHQDRLAQARDKLLEEDGPEK